MSPLVKIDSNYPDDLLRIELFLGNSCNYKCWYCFPGYNEGTVAWPRLESINKNLSHLINYYKKNTPKKRVNLHIIGGEPTLWKDFDKFIGFFKQEHGCIISTSTNGSRTLRWWEEHGQNLDHVIISCHHERVDAKHISQVADILYNKNVTVNACVLMDPNEWDKCLGIIEKLKDSKNRWLITAIEVLHDTVRYTDEQKAYMIKPFKRYPEINFWFKNQKLPRYKPTLYFEDGTSKKVHRNWLVLNKMHYFYGWQCNIGVETFFIDSTGTIRGACNQTLYGLDTNFNIYDDDFIEKFNIDIVPSICNITHACDCQPETNTSKFRLDTVKKIIPILQDRSS